jgi:hypothetical protein
LAHFFPASFFEQTLHPSILDFLVFGVFVFVVVSCTVAVLVLGMGSLDSSSESSSVGINRDEVTKERQTSAELQPV